MISSFARHIYHAFMAQESKDSSTRLEAPKTLPLELDFINYLGNKKVLEGSYDLDQEFKTVLFDWFLDIKIELKHKIKSKKEIHDSLNIFWIFITKIWQTQGYLPFKIRNLEDLKQVLAQEKKFHESVLIAIKTNNQSQIQSLIKRGLVELNDGMYHPTMKATPIFINLTFFYNMATPLHNLNGCPDIKDLKIMFEYYFDKVVPMHQNFDLKSSVEQHYRLFVIEFSSFMQENNLFKTYRNTISTINHSIQEIKAWQILQKDIEEQTEKKIKEQNLLFKAQIAEQTLVTKKELQDRKHIFAESDKELVKLMENHYLTTKESFSKDLQKSEVAQFLALNESLFLETKTLHAEKISNNLIKYFTKTSKKIQDLPKRLENLKSLESEERKKLISNLELKMQNFQQEQALALEILKIKILKKKRFECLGNYFTRKLRYEIFDQLPPALKFPILEDKESKLRNFFQEEETSIRNDLFFKNSVDLLQTEETLLRNVIQSNSEFSVGRTHTPYGGSPLKMIKAPF